MINFQDVKEEILEKRSGSKFYFDKTADSQQIESVELRICHATPNPKGKTMKLWRFQGCSQTSKTEEAKWGI